MEVWPWQVVARWAKFASTLCSLELGVRFAACTTWHPWRDLPGCGFQVGWKSPGTYVTAGVHVKRA